MSSLSMHTGLRALKSQRRAIVRGRRSCGTALALVAVFSLSGHLLLEWGGEQRDEAGAGNIRTLECAHDCPLCRIIALGAADCTSTVLLATALHATPLAPPPAPDYLCETPLAGRPRAPPV